MSELESKALLVKEPNVGSPDSSYRGRSAAPVLASSFRNVVGRITIFAGSLVRPHLDIILCPSSTLLQVLSALTYPRFTTCRAPPYHLVRFAMLAETERIDDDHFIRAETVVKLTHSNL